MRQSIIKTEAEYQQALKRLDQLFDAPENTPEGDEAELLVSLIEKYEEHHVPIPFSDPGKN
ncbi:MAG: transcriptional regulator [Cyclobacteriaceae bacterium]|nr:transcriptional regulator [Cyclobacteriaceae bacterium SS2]